MKSILKQFVSPKRVQPNKRFVIDFVFDKMKPQCKSFADLGGCWMVDGSYTFYTLDSYKIERAYLVDTDVTERAALRAKHYPNLTVVQGNFSDPDVIRKIGPIDCVFLFDVLLHQVKPDWDEVLRNYAEIAKVIVVFNQQFTGFAKTTRLMDLGEEEYFKSVPHSKEEYSDLFSKLDELHPQHGRPHRDAHNYWQWAITDDDLIQTMKALNYKLDFYANFGQFLQVEKCENHAFVFQR